MEGDLKEMGVAGWRCKALDREKWSRIIGAGQGSTDTVVTERKILVNKYILKNIHTLVCLCVSVHI